MQRGAHARGARDALPSDLALTHAFVAQWRSESEDSGDDPVALARGDGERTAPALRLESADAAAKKRVKVHTRTRRAQEIARLRAERGELETQLALARGVARALSTRSLGGSVDSCCPATSNRSSARTTPATVSEQQQQQAEREQSALLQSKAEHKRLRAELKAYKQIARGVYRVLLRRAADMTTLQRSLHCPPPSLWTLSPHVSDDRFVFRQLLADTQAMFRDVESVAELLRTRVQLSATGSFREWDVHRHQAPTVLAPVYPSQIQVVDCEELPFSQSQVHEAIRVFYKESEVRDLRFIRGDDGDDDDHDDRWSETIVMKMLFSYGSEATGLVNIRMRQVVRSFHAAQCSGFVSMLVVDQLTDEWTPWSGSGVTREQKWTLLPRGITALCAGGDGRDEELETTLAQTFAMFSHESAQSNAGDAGVMPLAAEQEHNIEAWDTGYSTTNRKIQNYLMRRATGKAC